ncbi:hypothetical protein HJFPF1_13058 [Paramyrothecium foliicola]|nr:hypothetical protein HJFPF1_13058 [Paramyrothecium foliicola]
MATSPNIPPSPAPVHDENPMRVFNKLPSEIWMRIASLSDAQTAASFAAANKHFRALFIRALYHDHHIVFEAEPWDLMLLLQSFVDIDTAPQSDNVFEYIRHASITLTKGGYEIDHLDLVEALPSLLARTLSKLRNVLRLDLDLVCLDHHPATRNLIAAMQSGPQWNVHHLNIIVESDLSDAVLKQCTRLRALSIKGHPNQQTLTTIMERHTCLESLYVPFWCSGGLTLDGEDPLSQSSLRKFLRSLPLLHSLVIYDLNVGWINGSWWAGNPYTLNGFITYILSVVGTLQEFKNLRRFAADLPFDPRGTNTAQPAPSADDVTNESLEDSHLENGWYCAFAKRRLELVPHLEQFSIVIPRSIHSARRCTTEGEITMFRDIDCSQRVDDSFPHSLLPKA